MGQSFRGNEEQYFCTGVYVQLAALAKLEHCRRGDRFGKGPETKKRGGSGGRVILHVGRAKALDQ